VSERIKRPPIERTEPLRGWQGVFGPPTDQAAGDADGQGGVRGGHAVEHAVAKSVEIGYQVIDHYLRQGQEVARTVREGRASTASLVRDTTDLSTRMIQYASDFVGTWMELLEIVVANPAAAFTAPQPRPPAASCSPADVTAPPATTPVVLAVQTTRPVEAILDCDDVNATTELRVSALRAADPRCPRIDAVVVTRAGGRVVVSVTVADQPSGEYEGVLTDSLRNLPVGRVRITIP
jgi:hypothetical protein